MTYWWHISWLKLKLRYKWMINDDDLYNSPSFNWFSKNNRGNWHSSWIMFAIFIYLWIRCQDQQSVCTQMLKIGKKYTYADYKSSLCLMYASVSTSWHVILAVTLDVMFIMSSVCRCVYLNIHLAISALNFHWYV